MIGTNKNEPWPLDFNQIKYSSEYVILTQAKEVSKII